MWHGYAVPNKCEIHINVVLLQLLLLLAWCAGLDLIQTHAHIHIYSFLHIAMHIFTEVDKKQGMNVMILSKYIQNRLLIFMNGEFESSQFESSHNFIRNRFCSYAQYYIRYFRRCMFRYLSEKARNISICIRKLTPIIAFSADAKFKTSKRKRKHF